MLRAIVSITLYLSASETFNMRVPANHEPQTPIVAPISICGQGNYGSGDIFYIDNNLSKCYQTAMEYNASAVIIDNDLWGDYVFQHGTVIARATDDMGFYIKNQDLINAEIAPDPTKSIFASFPTDKIIFFLIIINTLYGFHMLLKFVKKYTNLKLKREFIPISKYNGDQQDICSICLEDFQKNEIIRTTKCNHIFHEKCLNGWIHDERPDLKCPNCNGLLFT